jgi:hypothetical protein
VQVEALDRNDASLALQDTVLATPALAGDIRWAPGCDAGQDVVVRGMADPWLAGMADGSIVEGNRAPEQSPVRVLQGYDLSVGGSVTFRANGIVFVVPGLSGRRYPNGNHPDFNPPFNPFPFIPPFTHGPTGAVNGFSGMTTRGGALIGIFLGPDDPTPAPPPLTMDPALESARTASPQLKQLFYVGAGCTANFITTGCIRTGTDRQIAIPPGATRLYLGVMDFANWTDNSGAFQVTVRLAGPAATATSVGTASRGSARVVGRR